MKDRTGRELQKAQIVDFRPDAMLRAYVIDVQDGGLADAEGKVQPAKLIISVSVPIYLEPGVNAPVYIVQDAPEKKEESQVGED